MPTRKRQYEETAVGKAVQDSNQEFDADIAAASEKAKRRKCRDQVCEQYAKLHKTRMQRLGPDSEKEWDANAEASNTQRAIVADSIWDSCDMNSQFVNIGKQLERLENEKDSLSYEDMKEQMSSIYSQYNEMARDMKAESLRKNVSGRKVDAMAGTAKQNASMASRIQGMSETEAAAAGAEAASRQYNRGVEDARAQLNIQIKEFDELQSRLDLANREREELKAKSELEKAEAAAEARATRQRLSEVEKANENLVKAANRSSEGTSAEAEEGKETVDNKPIQKRKRKSATPDVTRYKKKTDAVDAADGDVLKGNMLWQNELDLRASTKFAREEKKLKKNHDKEAVENYDKVQEDLKIALETIDTFEQNTRLYDKKKLKDCIQAKNLYKARAAGLINFMMNNGGFDTVKILNKIDKAHKKTFGSAPNYEMELVDVKKKNARSSNNMLLLLQRDDVDSTVIKAGIKAMCNEIAKKEAADANEEEAADAGEEEAADDDNEEAADDDDEEAAPDAADNDNSSDDEAL